MLPFSMLSFPSTVKELEERLHEAGQIDEEELQSGHQDTQRRQAQSETKRKGSADLKKKKKPRYRQRITNVHMLAELPWLAESGSR